MKASIEIKIRPIDMANLKEFLKDIREIEKECPYIEEIHIEAEF